MSDPLGIGIPCPDCGGPTDKTVESRKRDGFIYRRRECQQCGERVSTYERVPNDDTLREWRLLQKLYSSLADISAEVEQALERHLEAVQWK